MKARLAARGAAQAALYAAFAGALATLCGWPPYRQLAPDEAVVKVSLRHAGALIGECRTLSAGELEALPPNMRAPQVCPRQRSPLVLELDLNGERLVDTTIEPQGLHGDGRAVFYRHLRIPAGVVHVDVRMKDDVASDTFAYRNTFDAVIEPGRALIVDFDDSSRSFVFL